MESENGNRIIQGALFAKTKHLIRNIFSFYVWLFYLDEWSGYNFLVVLFQISLYDYISQVKVA